MLQRGRKFIEQYGTFVNRTFTKEELKDIEIVQHIWSSNDRFYKLADKYYGDSHYWWIIAWFNDKPTEHHLTVGDVLSIPTPLSSIMNLWA